jgi:tetratricopeptide (TPR) repeat protein
MIDDLQDQRDFLLRSLEDLEAEHDAGDIAEPDYQVLKDDYTARAAAVLRAIDAHQPRVRSGRRSSTTRRVATVAAVLAFAGLAGLLTAQASGRRDAGDLGSGDVRRSVTEKLNEAGRRLSEDDPDAAIALYDEILEDQPTNAEALTYKGWTLYILKGDAEPALDALLDAATANPDYPDVHAFLAVVFARAGLIEEAQRALDRLDALDPSPDIVLLTAGLRAQLAAASSSTTAP